MTVSRLKPTLLAASVGLLLACLAQAQTPSAADAAKARELAAARADLDRAARRVAELSRGMTPDNVAMTRVFDRQPVLGVVLEADDRAETDEDRQVAEDAVRLYDQGWSIRQVAEKFGLEYTTMRRILKRNGVRFRRQGRR